jgi:hypothetical protein
MYNPIVINLIEEHNLGWDTAFYFPWLLMPPHPNHRGCNFFIQYKLSKLIEGPSGGEYSLWKCPYLRFQIPYFTRYPPAGQYLYDYNQFDNLKELANQGYFVYYATNHVVYDDELFQITASQHLLDEIPFLDVSMMYDHHRKVTFTQNSSYFYLHSETRQIDITNWKQIYSVIKKSEGTSLSNDIKFMTEFIPKLEKTMNIPKKGGYQEDLMKIRDIPKPDKIFGEAIVVLKYLKKYLNVYWYKLWSEFR